MKTELRIPSDLKFLTVVEHWFFGSLEVELNGLVDWQPQSTRLRLAIVEAYSNVVIHAHKKQANIPVLLRLEIKEFNIVLEIWDYGNGFDISTYLPPQPEDKQEGGYGLSIINNIMDRVEYSLQPNGAYCLKLETSLSVVKK
ncbi:MAG: ATP-binding protein [Moorea sp. SIO2B7]|nr:ATP-binding protein [Moorena sp. SIO2B7]